MRKLLVVSLLLLGLTGPGGTASAGDVARGQELLEKHCYGCHGEDVYVRENRIIKDFPSLQKRVKFCSQQVGVAWFDEEIGDVVEYLNAEFYNFKK